MRSLSARGSAAKACAMLAQPSRSGPRGRRRASRRCAPGRRAASPALRSRMRPVTSTTACFMGMRWRCRSDRSRRWASFNSTSTRSTRPRRLLRRPAQVLSSSGSAAPVLLERRRTTAARVLASASSCWSGRDASTLGGDGDACFCLTRVSARLQQLGRAPARRARRSRGAKATGLGPLRASAAAAAARRAVAAAAAGGHRRGRALRCIGIGGCRRGCPVRAGWPSTIPAMAMTTSTATAILADGA